MRSGTKAFVSGWGRTETVSFSKQLRCANVTIIEDEVCSADNPFFTDTQICTDSDGVGPCKVKFIGWTVLRSVGA